MKKYLYLLIVILALMFMVGCEDSTNPISEESGSLPIEFSIAPLEELDVDVTSGIVTLSKGDLEVERSMLIQDSNASVTVEGLEPGIWDLLVQLYSNEYLVAEGNAQVEILPGQESEVNLTLLINDITGSVTINVDWEIVEALPNRILFIGNSYTYYNNGLDNMLREYASNSNQDIELETLAITGGGMTLENHFNSQNTINAIQSEAWDIVVLQEQSQMPILDTEHFLTYASKLDSLIDLTGAQTCFFMTWAREYDQSQIEGLAAAYNQAGQECDAIVVPVGQVFNSVFVDDYEINLYAGDGSHPSPQGSYLASACFYRRLFNLPANETSFVAPNVTDADAEYIQESVEEWFAHN